jgi:recombination protein RecR
MSAALDTLQGILRKLPGLGARSAGRLAVHLLVEKPERLKALMEALGEAAERIGRCPVCGNLSERTAGSDSDDPVPPCAVCADARRDCRQLCLVEQIADLLALERAGAYKGLYHVLHGKLSPVNGIGERDLNLASLRRRLAEGSCEEIILALSNDIEGEATCHYLREEILQNFPKLRVSRIGFGLPSGGGLVYADAHTLQSALEARRHFS